MTPVYAGFLHIYIYIYTISPQAIESPMEAPRYDRWQAQGFPSDFFFQVADGKQVEERLSFCTYKNTPIDIDCPFHFLTRHVSSRAFQAFPGRKKIAPGEKTWTVVEGAHRADRWSLQQLPGGPGTRVHQIFGKRNAMCLRNVEHLKKHGRYNPR